MSSVLLVGLLVPALVISIYLWMEKRQLIAIRVRVEPQPRPLLRTVAEALVSAASLATLFYGPLWAALVVASVLASILSFEFGRVFLAGAKERPRSVKVVVSLLWLALVVAFFYACIRFAFARPGAT